MASTFDRRMQQLDRKVGRGKLVASVVVDQVYAKYQHENMRLKHPRGGKAKFLYEALVEHHGEYLQHTANHVLRGNLQQAHFRNARYLAVEIMNTAPVELGDLRRSGAPRLLDNGQLVDSRPPIQHRLSKAELRAKYRVRDQLLHRRLR